MVALGREVDLPAVAVISSMSAAGAAIGNALEVQEAVDTLRGQGPRTCWSLRWCWAPRCSPPAGPRLLCRRRANGYKATISSGEAFGALEGLVSRLGGDPESLTRAGGCPRRRSASICPPHVPGTWRTWTPSLADRRRWPWGPGGPAGRADRPRGGGRLARRSGRAGGAGGALGPLHARESLALDSEPVRRLRGASPSPTGPRRRRPW